MWRSEGVSRDSKPASKHKDGKNVFSKKLQIKIDLDNTTDNMLN